MGYYLIMALAWLATTARAEQKIDFNIPAGELQKTILDFYRQSHMEVLFVAIPEVLTTRTAEVHGQLEPGEALGQMLQGSSLTWKLVDHHTAIIRTSVIMRDPGPVDDPESTVTIRASQLADSESEVTVVTGTHMVSGVSLAAPFIAGSVSAPVGALTVDDAPTTSSWVGLPQNSLNAPRVDFAIDGNRQHASAPNFRGLGVADTLVLVNSRRQPGAGLDGRFVDLSSIPSAAVERLEILFDGASDLFGADAIGGVLNVVMKDRLDGANTVVQFGGEQGGAHTRVVSQSFGTLWDTGRALLAYQHSDTTALVDPDRVAQAGSWHLPVSDQLFPQTRANVLYTSASQLLAPNVELFADARLAQRSVIQQDVPGLPQSAAPVDPLTSSTQTRTYIGTLEARFHFDQSGWQVALADTSGRQALFGDDYSPQQKNSYHAISGMDTATLFADGPIAQLPAGLAKLAFGAARRQETLRDDVAYADERTGSGSYSRADTSAVSEMWLPLLPGAHRPDSSSRLSMALIERFNHYSDWGGHLNPMGRLYWTAFQGLQFQLSWASLMRPPTLGELHEFSSDGAVLLMLPNPTPAHPIAVLAIRGGSPRLRPETATTRSAEVKIAPEVFPGLRVLLRYYAIDLWNRIARPGSDAPWDILANTHEWGAFITPNPTPAQLAAACAQVAAAFPYCPQSTPAAIADESLTNLASTQVRGIDIDAKQSMYTRLGRLAFDVNGSILTRFTQAATPTSTSVEIANTVGNQQALRLRLDVNWRPLVRVLSDMVLQASVHYTGGYSNPASTRSPRVAPWTTVDTAIRYSIPTRYEWLDDMEFEVSVTNLLAKAPPYVDSPLRYDLNNVQPDGRFLSLSASKHW